MLRVLPILLVLSSSLSFGDTVPADMRLPDTFPDKLFKAVKPDVRKAIHEYLANPGERTENIVAPDGKVIFRSFRKLDEKTGYLALAFEGYLDVPFEGVTSVWFANSRQKSKFMDHCQEFLALESTPVTTIDEGVFTFTKTVLFKTDPMLMVWSRLLFSDNIIVVNKKERWIGGVAYSTTNPERFFPGLQDVDSKRETVTAQVFFATSFIKEEANGVWVNFSAYINANGKGGRIPAFIVNAVSASWPRNTKEKLVDLVKNHPGEFDTIDFMDGSYDPRSEIEKTTLKTSLDEQH